MKNHDRHDPRLVALRPKEQAPRAEITPIVEGPTATLRIYDPIDSWGDWFGVSAKEVAKALDDIGGDVTEIRLHINSPGGEVFEAIAIANQLRNHPARVVAIVDGIAASAASFIAALADEVVMAPHSELMIHDAWGRAVGDAADMRWMADQLDRLSNNIASMYAGKAGGTVEEWREVMRAEAWYSAEEAVEAGLADRVDDTDEDVDAKARHDLSYFQFAGRAEAPAPPPAPSATPTAEAVDEVTPDPVGDAEDAAAAASEDNGAFEERLARLRSMARHHIPTTSQED